MRTKIKLCPGKNELMRVDEEFESVSRKRPLRKLESREQIEKKAENSILLPGLVRIEGVNRGLML